MNNRKGSAFFIVLVVLAVMAIATGCVNQLWPVQSSSQAVTSYIGEPNAGFPISTMGKAKADVQKARAKHVITAIELKAAIDKDDAMYALVTEELNLRIQAAQQSYDKYIGTPEAPGLLGAGLFAALAGLGVNLYNKKTMYSEAEVAALNVRPTEHPKTT